MILLHRQPLVAREGRHLIGWAQVGKDGARPLHARERAYPDSVLDGASGGLGWRVQDAAIHVVLPAVIYAAQTALFIAPEKERCAAVRAELGQQPWAALGVAKSDQVLPEQADPYGVAIGLGQLARQQGRQPVVAEDLAQGCVPIGPSD